MLETNKKPNNNPLQADAYVVYNPETSKKSVSQEIFEKLVMEFYGEKIGYGTSCTLLSILADVKHKLIHAGFIIKEQAPLSDYYISHSNQKRIQAYQWIQNGDHPLDDSEELTDFEGQTFKSEGKIVRRYNHPMVDGEKVTCSLCHNPYKDHGWLDKEDTAVCPGDYILGEKNGFRWVLPEQEFKKHYKLAD